jgi:MFS family permease
VSATSDRDDAAAAATTGVVAVALLPDFSRLWVARGISAIGFQCVAVAVAWQLYLMTGSALDLGLLGLAQFVPLFAVTPIAGYVADRFDRRRVAALCQGVTALIAVALAVGTWRQALPREAIFALMALAATSRAFEFPALSSLLPSTVPRGALQQATALYSSAMQTALIVGPALGGLLLLVSPVTAFGVAATLIGSAAGIVSSISVGRVEQRAAPPTLSNLFAGIAFLRVRPELLGSMLLDVVAVMVGAATALLPIYAKDILGTGPEGLGLLRAAPAVGAVAMAMWLASHPIRGGAGAKMLGGITAYGLATLVLGLSSNFALAMLALIAVGAADMISVVVRQSLVQLRTPDDMRGRVGAVNSMMAISANQLGDFRAGVLAAAIGAGPAIITGGIAAIGVAVCVTWRYPEIRHIDRLDERA